MRTFELTFKGFNGDTDKTDHLVRWVNAQDRATLDVWIEKHSLRPYLSQEPQDITGNWGLDRSDGVDYVVGEENRQDPQDWVKTVLTVDQIITQFGMVEDTEDERWKDDPDKRLWRGSRFTCGNPHAEWHNFDVALRAGIFNPETPDRPGWQYVEDWQLGRYRAVWVDPSQLAFFTYCEGDLTLVVLATKQRYNEEWDAQATSYK